MKSGGGGAIGLGLLISGSSGVGSAGSSVEGPRDTIFGDKHIDREIVLKQKTDT